jgi:predicted ATPase/DNA-binding winged helix-turn-helix (wHTH) protein
MQVQRFRGFEIRPSLRQIWVDGTATPVGTRAYDLLMLLLTNADRVVTKEEIFEQVWPGLVVEENNLSVQISVLRRLLGADVISTAKGRGYQFTAVRAQENRQLATQLITGNLSPRALRLVGREAELNTLIQTFVEARCVTVCGLAGVGKTALADVAALQLAEQYRYPQGAWKVELANIRDADLLSQTICQALGIELTGHGSAFDDCLTHLRHCKLLLVLDNCEHLIDVVAALVDNLLATGSAVHILCTSQQPLNIVGEELVRLSPLPVPKSSEAKDAAEFSSVQLMLERVRSAAGGKFAPLDDEFIDLVEICRQLEGVPLALEFAATRVPLLGVAGVLSRLNDRLKLLTSSNRSAPERHRSLQAALEWSHQLLSQRTQWIFDRLAIFPGGFSLTGAQFLLDMDSESELIEHLNVLVDRSLICVESGTPLHYKMLDTTRAFALDSLAASDDSSDWNHRFVVCMANLCVLAARERDSGWMWREMHNARAALVLAAKEPRQANAAITIATYTSVVLAAGGAIREGLDNLASVRPLVTEELQPALAARYWQWYGRLGVEGRLPTSVCIDALKRAEHYFLALDEHRHSHACYRYLAEAQLRAGQLDQAQQSLQQARALEGSESVPADRLRRLRVEALLADALKDYDAALRYAQAALTIAEAHHVDRYKLLLMADMGWIYLQRGSAEAAVDSFQELLLHLDPSIRQGLARAHALSGLAAAFVVGGMIPDAVRVAQRAVPVLLQTNLLRARCEMFAWIAAAAGHPQTAARLLGVAQGFVRTNEIEWESLSTLAREQTSALLGRAISDEELTFWSAEAANTSDTEILSILSEFFEKTTTAPLTLD